MKADISCEMCGQPIREEVHFLHSCLSCGNQSDSSMEEEDFLLGVAQLVKFQVRFSELTEQRREELFRLWSEWEKRGMPRSLAGQLDERHGAHDAVTVVSAPQDWRKLHRLFPETVSDFVRLSAEEIECEIGRRAL